MPKTIPFRTTSPSMSRLAPRRAAMSAVFRATEAYGPNADRDMDGEQQRSHACRILLRALAALRPDYSEALDALEQAERTLDNADIAVAYLEAAGVLSALSEQHEGMAEADPRIERDDRAFLAARRAELI